MRHITNSLLLGSLFLVLGACSSLTDSSTTNSLSLADELMNGEEIRAIKSRYERFASVCVGDYNNFTQVADLQESGQAAKLPPAASMRQRIATRRVWHNRSDAIWLYSEMYLVDLMEAPVLQKFMAVRRISPDTIEMETFEIPAPDRFINEWQKEPKQRFANLRPSDLIPIEGCLNYFVEEKKGVFQSTQPKDWCEQQVGASKGFKENIRYAPEQMLLRTFGRDAKGQEMWAEFKEHPMIFTREIKEGKQ